MTSLSGTSQHYKSENKMDSSRKVVLALALSEYKELQTKYALHLQYLQEEDRKRRRAAILAALHPRPQITLKTGAEWEVMLNMEDRSFVHHFRLSKQQYEYLQMKLQESGLNSEHSQGAPPVPVPTKVLMFLWYMASQSSFREMSKKFDIAQSSAHRVILQVLSIMSGMGTTFISWPNECKKRASAAAFHRICGLEGVIGVIDGCHIRLQRPPIRGGEYMNRKSYYSVLLQGIVDEQGRFIDIFAGLPGRVHDARMLRASTFYSEWQEKMGKYHLLGDSAYNGQSFPFIITPKPDNRTLTEADFERNAKISQGKVIVKQAFEKMKCKWRRLRDLQNSRIDYVVMIIMAACFLHNFSFGDLEVCQEHPHGCPRQEDDNV